MPRLLIAASGTGGHIFPALAVAEELPDSWELSWLGVPDRLEAILVPDCYPLLTLNVQGLQGGGLKKFSQFVHLLLSTRKVRQFLIHQEIDAVFTTGGYIAAPAILAAILCGLPVLLHESNAMPGRVTRLLGRFCTLVALGLPSSAGLLPKCRTFVTGTPVRAEFLSPQPLPSWVPVGTGPLIVVMGGSQGALGLNHMVRSVLPSFLEKGCRVVHLTGKNDLDLQKFQHPNLMSRAFSDEISGLLQHADLVVSRAGASAISELAVCGTPAILIPYPQATDRHQDANANCAAALGAAVIVHQQKGADRALGDALNRLLNKRLFQADGNFDPLAEMQLGMAKLARRDAQKTLTSILDQFI